jgi:hypothetical protein
MEMNKEHFIEKLTKHRNLAFEVPGLHEHSRWSSSLQSKTELQDEYHLSHPSPHLYKILSIPSLPQ